MTSMQFDEVEPSQKRALGCISKRVCDGFDFVQRHSLRSNPMLSLNVAPGNIRGTFNRGGPKKFLPPAVRQLNSHFASCRMHFISQPAEARNMLAVTDANLR